MLASISDHIEIHFEVPDNMLSAQTLAEVANGLQKISDVVFEETVEPGKQAEIYLCIPKYGCFEAIFKIVAPIATGALTGIIGKQFINTFIKNMIGIDLIEVTEFTTTKVTDSVKKNLLVDYASTAISAYLSQKVHPISSDHDFVREFNKMQSGKNQIYTAISEDPRISRISYKDSDYIDRKDFYSYTAEIPDDEDHLGQVGFYEGEIKIISPVSLKEKSRRGWTGLFLAEGEHRVERTFEIDDENFRQYALSNKIRIAVDDIAEVQMIRSSSQSPQWRVLKVIKFGGAKISPRLTTEELKKMSIKPITDPPQLQHNLFDVI